MAATTYPLQTGEGRQDERIVDPCIFVIFGASGDLTKRKLLPALYHLDQSGLLPEEFVVVGVARRDLSASFALEMREGILNGGGVSDDDPRLEAFINRVKYFATNFDDDLGFETLRLFLVNLDEEFGTRGNRLFYLAVAPDYFADIVRRLDAHDMASPNGDVANWTRVIIEKPFGTELESARKLNDEINAVLSEEQIFRIDHYLGKETVQNILVLRFANGTFEPLWNRNYIDHVEITAAESIGIEGRGPFYERAGAVRDVLQNHVMEVLWFVRNEKLKVWRSIKSIPLENAVRGQYGPGEVDGKHVVGYRQEDRVDPESNTETFGAIRIEIDNWRWAGVPFYLRAGKRLEKRLTEVSIVFKQPPTDLFQNNSSGQGLESNVLAISHSAR
jgi:glucose-6-phosphate 1-dehydrogenase